MLDMDESNIFNIYINHYTTTIILVWWKDIFSSVRYEDKNNKNKYLYSNIRD